MAGDTLMVVEDFHRTMREPDIDSAADQPVRHGVKVLVDLDVIIGMDLRALPFGIFEGCRRQRSQGGALNLLEQLPAGFADMTHRSSIQIFQQNGDGSVEIGKAEETPIS